MAKAKYNLEHYMFFSDCSNLDMNTTETAEAFNEYYGIEILNRAAEGHMDRLELWIYMLSARHDVTREEAVEDFYNHLVRRVRINWIDNPKYDKFIVDTAGESVQEAVYKFYQYHNVKATSRIISGRRSRAYAAGKINEENRHTGSSYRPFKVVKDKIHPDFYITYGNDSVINAESPVSVTCYAMGHITIKVSMYGVYERGCGECLKLKVGTGVVYSEEYFKEHPAVANQLGVLYDNFLMHEEEKFIKVGIAKGDIKTAVDKRYKQNHCTPYGYEKDDVIVGTTLENWRSEQYLLTTLYPREGPLQYKPNHKFSGWTECIIPEKREEVRKWFKEERIRRKAGIMPKKNILR